MRLLRPSSEAEMVALFLRTKLPAARWQHYFKALLERAGLPERVLTDPDLGDDAENQARLRLLTRHRGYGTRIELFDGFPYDVRWQLMTITPAKLARSGSSTTTTGLSYRAAPAWRPTPLRASVPVWPRSGCPATGR